MRVSLRVTLFCLVIVPGWVPVSLAAERSPSSDAFESLEVRSVSVNNKFKPPGHNGDVSLGANPENISFSFGIKTNARQSPLRVRYKLDGYDSDWRDGGSEMVFGIRFYNVSGDQIVQKNFPASGASAGWNGSLANSPLTHRRETLLVPDQASRLWVVITSAGPPSAVGVYVIANVVVSKNGTNGRPTVLLESPFTRTGVAENTLALAGWTRDGIRSSMANIVTVGGSPEQKAFAILDDDGRSHAEWHNIMEAAPAVTPGEQILVEWDEAFSIGVADGTIASYASLPGGNYHFVVAGFDIYGNPTGPRASVSVLVPPTLWRTAWFWAAATGAAMLMVLGAWRYLVWRGVRREMVRLRSERALENERLRIAQDLHDDFGARLTEISIASALAKKKLTSAEAAGADFDRISKLSRELVTSLYETVWAVNPENDNLDALGNYLCQMANNLCEQVQLPCRLQMRELPLDIKVSSQTRHNIIMAVKEAIHNVIKHAHASEVILSASYENGALTISVHDNGCGFQTTSRRNGNGLGNMNRRLSELGGTCEVQNPPGAGSRIVFMLNLSNIPELESASTNRNRAPFG